MKNSEPVLYCKFNICFGSKLAISTTRSLKVSTIIAHTVLTINNIPKISDIQCYTWRHGKVASQLQKNNVNYDDPPNFIGKVYLLDV